MKKIILILTLACIVAPVLSLTIALPCMAATNKSKNITTDDVWGGHWEGDSSVTKDADTVTAESGLGDKDPREVISNVINIILGFLGIIAVVLILAGGFMWMTAAGNEDKVGQAKSLMMAGVVGLVIILAAFGIAKFVVNALVGATTTP